MTAAENRIKKINELADRIRNPQKFKGFDPNNPFKDHERLRKKIVELTRIHDKELSVKGTLRGL
jgi:hypothetical protein